MAPVPDTWRTNGLCGAGNHGIFADGAFVPTHCTVLREALAIGRRDMGATHCRRIPYALVASLMLGVPVNAQISRGRYQSVLLRARRGTLSPGTSRHVPWRPRRPGYESRPGPR